MLSEEAIACHAALSGAVKVKPLVWEDADEGFCTKWKAPALAGSYDLVDFDGRAEQFAVNFHWGRPLAFWFIQGEPDQWGYPTGPKLFDSVDDAKAAAQSDYEARVLSALEPVHNAERAELARQNAALRAQVASLTTDNEALQRTVAKMCAAFNEITDPDTIWRAIDGVHDFDASLNDYAAAVSKAQRAEWEASK